MLSLIRGASPRAPTSLPLFPLKAVLFPGGLLPLKIFEQRYIGLTKSCLKDGQPFGVVLITQGDEVASRESGASAAQFARVGTMASITSWDMPQLGILHIKTEGGTRFQVQSHEAGRDGLVVAQVSAIPVEPKADLPKEFEALAVLLDRMIESVGAQHFAGDKALGDASWVSYRLAELLPLPLPIKQSMLEINDSLIRLKVIAQFLAQQALL